jgi:hypothetical protein
MSEYKIEVVEKKEGAEIHCSGNLVINNIEKIVEDIRENVSLERGYTLFVDNPENLDITFIQLIISMRKQIEAGNNKLAIKMELKDDMRQLITKSGLDYAIK